MGKRALAGWVSHQCRHLAATTPALDAPSPAVAAARTLCSSATRLFNPLFSPPTPTHARPAVATAVLFLARRPFLVERRRSCAASATRHGPQPKPRPPALTPQRALERPAQQPCPRMLLPRLLVAAATWGGGHHLVHSSNAWRSGVHSFYTTTGSENRELSRTVNVEFGSMEVWVEHPDYVSPDCAGCVSSYNRSAVPLYVCPNTLASAKCGWCGNGKKTCGEQPCFRFHEQRYVVTPSLANQARARAWLVSGVGRRGPGPAGVAPGPLPQPEPPGGGATAPRPPAARGGVGAAARGGTAAGAAVRPRRRRPRRPRGGRGARCAPVFARVRGGFRAAARAGGRRRRASHRPHHHVPLLRCRRSGPTTTGCCSATRRLCGLRRT